MPLTVTAIPTVEVNNNVNTISKYFSLNRPILFSVQRNAVDFTFSSGQALTPTLIRLQAVGFGAMWSNTFTNGVDFFIEITGSTLPDGTYKVINDIFSNTDYIDLDSTGLGYDFPNTFTGGTLRVVRSNYRIKTQIIVNNVVLATLTNRVDLTDTAIIDVSPFLQSIITYNDDYDYNSINVKDIGRGQPFTVQFAESWSGFIGTYSNIGTFEYYIVNSVFQLHATYNGNMGLFVPFSNYATNDVRAKFLSDFKNPTFFIGYPFSLDFIFNNDLDTSNFDYTRKEQKKNVNLINSGVVESTTLLESEKKYVNRMKLTGNYNETIKFVDVWLEKQNSI